MLDQIFWHHSPAMLAYKMTYKLTNVTIECLHLFRLSVGSLGAKKLNQTITTINKQKQNILGVRHLDSCHCLGMSGP